MWGFDYLHDLKNPNIREISITLQKAIFPGQNLPVHAGNYKSEIRYEVSNNLIVFCIIAQNPSCLLTRKD